jgi:hypothetical protein
LYNRIKGEALCFRGWAHFNLVQLYAKAYKNGAANDQAGIPYRTAAVAEPLARSTVAEVYKNILNDLTEACTLLDGCSFLNYNHFNAMSAWGLKARVALAMQDYSNAATYAKKAKDAALAQGRTLMTGSQLNCGFATIATETKEAMFCALTQDDQTVYFYSFYAYMSWNFSSSAIRQGVKAINAETYDTMSETDLRRAWWDPTGTAEVPASNYSRIAYQNRKFTAVSTANAVGNVAFMRLAEIYLTEAEALARSNNLTEAQQVFTEFQVTRDPSYVATATSATQLIEEIMNSRRLELWGEGFRFYDLKRLGLPIKRGSNFDVSFCGFLEKDVDADGWVWEIPKSETNYNNLCTTNY